MTLSVKRIARLSKPGRYADGHGLYLQVTSPTSRSWIFRYERNHRERWMGLGPLHTFTLDEAREMARKARQRTARGQGPDGGPQGRAARASAAGGANPHI